MCVCGQGPVERAPLQLAAGDTYAFEMAAPEGVFELHPFALTQSASGPASSLYTDGASLSALHCQSTPHPSCFLSFGAGIQGDVPGNSDDMTFTFTPISRNGPTVLYYQRCVVRIRMAIAAHARSPPLSAGSSVRPCFA